MNAKIFVRIELVMNIEVSMLPGRSTFLLVRDGLKVVLSRMDDSVVHAPGIEQVGPTFAFLPLTTHAKREPAVSAGAAKGQWVDVWSCQWPELMIGCQNIVNPS